MGVNSSPSLQIGRWRLRNSVNFIRNRDGYFRLCVGVLLLAALLPAAASLAAVPKEIEPELWRRLQALPGIDVRQNATDLYQAMVIFDPACPHSRKLWNTVYGEGSRFRGVRSRWIPVAYIKAASLDAAAGLITQGSTIALARHFSDAPAKTLAPADPETRAAVINNTKFWQAWVPATPLVIFRSKDGKTYLQTGLPDTHQIEAILTDLHEARLQRFEALENAS